MSGCLLWACGDVTETGDDDDDAADAAASSDGQRGNADAAGGNTDATAGRPDAEPSASCIERGSKECTATQWCDFEQECGRVDGGAVCRPRPVACSEVKDPVCGCDLVTYGNECKANAAGQDVLHAGPCDTA